MPLATGTRFASYEVLGLEGVGGMGEVYRARDTKLGREVALKVLPERFATDAGRAARLAREAQVLAALNHPNVATIYGVEERDATVALVLELVPGPTLADLIARGALPIDQALSVARQIVDALDAAHERGIAHRDLKPANIKVRPDGTVKVLDFGLAKMLGPSGHGPADPATPPVSGPTATLDGRVLGTPGYMAPEQATGGAADERSDIWAFGVVLFEMLTGRRLFERQSDSQTLGHVLTEEPPWDRLPAATPEGVRRVLRRCLQNDRNRRLRHIADARWDLDGTAAPPPENWRG